MPEPVSLEDCRKAIELFIEAMDEVLDMGEASVASYRKMCLRTDHVEGLASSDAFEREIRFVHGYFEVKLDRDSLRPDAFYLVPCETDKETFERFYKVLEREYTKNGLKLWRPGS